MSSTISCSTEGQAKGAAAESEEKEGEGGEGGQCGAMQRLIGCSLWTHAANSNAIAVELAVGVVSLSLPLSPLSPGAHELATPPHNGPQAEAKSRARARVGVDQADTHSALEIGKLFSLLQWRSSGSGSS